MYVLLLFFVCLILLDALSLLFGTVICYLSLTLENSWYYLLFFWYSNYTCYTISCGLTAHSSWSCVLFSLRVSVWVISFGPSSNSLILFSTASSLPTKYLHFCYWFLLLALLLLFISLLTLPRYSCMLSTFSFKPFNILDTVIANALFDNFNI